MFLFLLVLCMLCGCDREVKETEPALLTDTVPVTLPATEDGLVTLEPTQSIPQEAPDTTPAAPVPGQHQAAYSILESDNSIRNDNDDILVNIGYQRVVLDNSQPLWDPINDLILADYQSFRQEIAYLYETEPEDWETQLQSMGLVYGNLMVNRSARVTNNSGGIFSIRMTQDWFMGGVFNSDSYGLNFDLNRGEALPLARMSELPEAEFEVQLKTIICEALEKDREVLFDDPAVILEAYTLEDFSFCVDEGELVLLFPTYTFGPGVMGSTEVRTGLYPKL